MGIHVDDSLQGKGFSGSGHGFPAMSQKRRLNGKCLVYPAWTYKENISEIVSYIDTAMHHLNCHNQKKELMYESFCEAILKDSYIYLL